MFVKNEPPHILIFGGTFDPPHLAHAKLPPIAAIRLGCQRILYIPAALNPLKTETPPTPSEHRVAMLQLAIKDVPNAEIERLELQREGPSYTVDTLEELSRRFGPETQLHLLIGADAALSFERWKDWQRILELAEPAVMPRPPYPREALMGEFRKRFEADQASFWIDRILDVPYMDLSATDVRRQLKTGGDLDCLLDPAVIEYIREHHLYGTSSVST